MNKKRVRELALSNGFKLKQQPSGEMDLNPYVYEFVDALLSKANERVKSLEQTNLELAANVESCCELVDMDMGAAIERLFEIDNTESKALLNKFAIEKKIDLLSEMVSSASDYMFNHDKLDIRANHLDMLLKNFCNYHREQLRKEQE